MNSSLYFSVRHYRLEFAHPFGIAHGTRNYTDTLYVRASFMDTHGYGEAALPPYLGHDAAQLAADFNRFFPAAMEGSEAIRLAMQKLSKTDEPIPLPLRTAVDIALHDLFGKLTGRTVRSIFGITDTVEALCSYTLGFSTVDELLARVEEAKDFRLFKVKLGDANDKERVTALLNAGKTNFCVDANQAWTSLSQSMDWINWLADRGCLFVEQPMPVDMAKDYEQLYRSSSLPILLDESVQDLRDLEDLRGVCHGINVKLVKCGGLEPAVKLVRQANKAGLKVLLGCMSESSCGALAAAQLSGWADWIDLDGPRLIRNDPFGGARYVQGQLLLNAEAGTGAILQDATLFGD